MFIENTYNGIVISDIVNNRRIWQRYIGISLPKCKQLFKQYVKSIKY